MADPLEVLRAPDTPIDPDPVFATRLRARIERALALPKGVAVTTTSPDRVTESPAGTGTHVGTDTHVRTGAPSAAVTPYLAVTDARVAIDWYREVLGAELVGEPIVMPDGKVGHAELRVAGARVFLADEHPDIGVAAPAPGAGAAVTLHLQVPDVDASTAGAAAADARVEREPSDNPYGRVGVIRDPFGHRWMLNTPPAPEPVGEGDVGFWSLWVDDVDRAAAFYAAVLGWRYETDHGPHRFVPGANPHGIASLDLARERFGPDRRHPSVLCVRSVTDFDAALDRVRAAGGRVAEPRTEPWGRIADCVDGQGLPFSLHEVPAGSPRPPTHGFGHGDLAYLTLQVRDGGAARDFHAAVFGWGFTPGRVEDGWQTDGPAPMTGLHGGHEVCTVVPMYRVDDIDSAVERVRAARGTSTEPERQPYGISAQCTDDQGTPFWLGEL